LGDCRAILPTLDAGSVRCVVTSPPYWGLRDYGVAGQIGLERTPEEFVEKITAVFREVRRVLAEDGTLWLNLGDTYAGGGRGGDTGRSGLQGSTESQDESKRAGGNRLGHRSAFKDERRVRMDVPHKGSSRLKLKDLVGLPWRVAFALQADGWYLRSDIIWHKANPMPESVRDRPTKAHEYVFLLSKSPHYYFNNEAVREKASPDSHARYGRGRSDSHKYADSTQTIARGFEHLRPGVNPKARHFPPNWAQGPGDHSALGHSRKKCGKGSRENVDRVPRPRNKQNESFSAAVKDVVESRNIRSVWTISSRAFRGAHFATFPEEVAARCILAGSAPGDVVLDPFFGSGTVGTVAERLGRKWIGCELSPAYVEIARKRTAQRGLYAPQDAPRLKAAKGDP
jgi:site-specific DNA-methyltransferase (cytosine-N4-specific)